MLNWYLIERRKLHMISTALSSFLRTNSTVGFNYKWSINAFKLISIERRKVHMISNELSSLSQTNSTGGFNYKWSITDAKLIYIWRGVNYTWSQLHYPTFYEQILRLASSTNELQTRLNWYLSRGVKYTWSQLHYQAFYEQLLREASTTNEV